LSALAQMIFNVLTVIAILVGPICAIEVQERLDEKREEKRRKIQVFRDLMITRSTRLSPRHVEALNALQMEFSESHKSEKRILSAWKLYLDHLGTPAATPGWADRSADLVIDLLYEMAIYLGYDFDKVRIKNETYLPQHFVDLEDEGNRLRKAAIEVFEGKQQLKVQLVEGVSSSAKPTLAA